MLPLIGKYGGFGLARVLSLAREKLELEGLLVTDRCWKEMRLMSGHVRRGTDRIGVHTLEEAERAVSHRKVRPSE